MKSSLKSGQAGLGNESESTAQPKACAALCSKLEITIRFYFSINIVDIKVQCSAIKVHQSAFVCELQKGDALQARFSNMALLASFSKMALLARFSKMALLASFALQTCRICNFVPLHHHRGLLALDFMTSS